MRNLGLLLLTFALTSCSLLSPVKTGPEHSYMLTTPGYPSVHQRSQLTLLVLPIESVDIYDTNLMAYSTKPYQIAYFSKNGWAQSPARMMQPLLIQTLQNAHYFHAVTTTASQYDYALSVQLLELKQNFVCHCPSQIQLKLRAQVINAKTNAVVATKQFTLTRTAPMPNPYGGVIAANAAVAEALSQITLFTIRSID